MRISADSEVSTDPSLILCLVSGGKTDLLKDDVCLRHYHIVEECQLSNWGKIVSSFERYLPLRTRSYSSTTWCRKGSSLRESSIYKSFTWDKTLISIVEKSPHCFIILVNVSWHSVFIAPAIRVYGSSSKGCPWIWYLVIAPSAGITAFNWGNLVSCINICIQPTCIRLQIAAKQQF